MFTSLLITVKDKSRENKTGEEPMKRKLHTVGIILSILIVILVAGYLGRTGYLKQKNEDTKQTSAQTGSQKAEAGQKQTVDARSDLQTEYDTILEKCQKEFISNRPINENFLAWFHSKYGDETLEQVADEVEKKEQDANLWYELTGNTMQVLWIYYCRDTGYQSELLENIYDKECAGEETVLDFTGDINLSEGWSTTVFMDKQANGIYDCLSSDLMLELQSADILLINNEYTYSNRGTPLAGKAYTFRAAPSRVEVLQQLGTDIVSLANNHVYDYGEEALLDTMDTLEQAQIPYVGAGRNLDEAEKIVYFIANGRKIAIVAATQIERSYSYTKEATKDSPGVLKTLNPDKFVEVIQEAKNNSDIVIAYPHWGTEGNHAYGADQKELAEAFVKAGADVIIGGHTHCLQGISYIENVPVLYSLGNFWFNNKTLDTGVAQVRIQKDGDIRFRFLPCIQSGTKTRLLTEGSQRTEVLNFMRELSKDVSIDEEGYVTNLSK